MFLVVPQTETLAVTIVFFGKTGHWPAHAFGFRVFWVDVVH